MDKLIEQIRILNETLSKDFYIESDINIKGKEIIVKLKIDNLQR